MLLAWIISKWKIFFTKKQTKVYPTYLVPKKSDKILNNNEIPKLDFLGVWVETDEDLEDENKNLKAEFINVHRLPHYSTNKIPPSHISDLSLSFYEEYKKLYTAVWKEGEEGINPLPDHFEFSTSRKYFFMKIEDINNYKSTYERVDKKNQQFEFTLSILHKPLVSNLWHFEFSIKTPDGELKKIDKKGYSNLIGASIRSHIRKIAKFKVA